MPDGTIPTPALRFIPAPLIVEAVAAALATTVPLLMGKRVLPGLHAGRQIACLLFAEFTLLSMVEMGGAIGRRSDTAGRYLLLGARVRLDEDQLFRSAFQQTRERLVQGFHGV